MSSHDRHSLETVRREVRVAHIADCLDQLGLRSQCVNVPIQPLTPQMRAIGRAFTISLDVVDQVPEIPYRGLLRALDALGKDEIYVIPTGGDQRASTWGELLSTTAIARGAVGAVTDGAVRDIAQVSALGFPTFAGGATPNDINGRYEVADFGTPVTLGNIVVSQGDLIAADIDGVVVVPKEAEDDVIVAALQKARTESRVKQALASGMLPSEAFATYGVL